MTDSPTNDSRPSSTRSSALARGSRLPSDSALNVHSDEPLCAGPAPASLVARYVTPVDLHYVRNHGSVPEVDERSYRLRVAGLARDVLDLSVPDLANAFERRSVTTTLQCAGNRRSELHRIAPYRDQVLWDGDAVGTAVWAGVRLADVLAMAGVRPTATHVWFEGLDHVELSDETTVYGASIDLARAHAPDVILAYEMNGGRLPPLHGAPLRVVVPGYIGARSVKWLDRIIVSDRPSENHFQAVSYLSETSVEGGGRLPLERSQLNSWIALPADGARVSGSPFRISGYATPGGGSAIDRVEASVDDGTWEPVELVDPPHQDVWVRWRARIDLDPGFHDVRVRASDTSGAMQPEDMAARWNAKGYMNDAWHAVTIRVGN